MNFRETLAALESTNELIDIQSEVNPEYELPALLQQAEDRSKAIRFCRLHGTSLRAAGGLFTSPERMALSLGKSLPADQTEPISDWLRDARKNPIEPIEINDAPVTEHSVARDRVDTSMLGAPRFFDGDSHQFLTAGLGVSRNPNTGEFNVGFYRVPILGKREISISAGNSSDLRRFYQATAKQATTMQIALIIGAPPALLFSAGSKVPVEISDYAIAGALQNKPIELTRCQTSDLMVPAQAELVIEATVNLGQWQDNVMGEYGDQYGVTDSPPATIDAITHRGDAISHVIMAGMNREHNTLGGLVFSDLRQQLLGLLNEDFACVKDVQIDLRPRRTGARLQIAVAIQKTSETQPAEILDSVFAAKAGSFPLDRLIQRAVIVDTDVDLASHEDVQWAIASRVDAPAKLQTGTTVSTSGDPTVYLAIDATMRLDQQEKMRRPKIKDVQNFRLDDYL